MANVIWMDFVPKRRAAKAHAFLDNALTGTARPLCASIGVSIESPSLVAADTKPHCRVCVSAVRRINKIEDAKPRTFTEAPEVTGMRGAAARTVL